MAGLSAVQKIGMMANFKVVLTGTGIARALARLNSSISETELGSDDGTYVQLDIYFTQIEELKASDGNAPRAG